MKYWDSIELENSVKIALLENFAENVSCKEASQKLNVSVSTISKAYEKFRDACCFCCIDWIGFPESSTSAPNTFAHALENWNCYQKELIDSMDNLAYDPECLADVIEDYANAIENYTKGEERFTSKPIELNDALKILEDGLTEYAINPGPLWDNIERLTNELKRLGHYNFIRFHKRGNGKISVGYQVRNNNKADPFKTYEKKYKPGQLYLMKSGTYKSKLTEDHKLYREPKGIIYSDPYNFGYVALTITDGVIKKPTKLRKRKKDDSGYIEKIPNVPRIKEAYLYIISALSEPKSYRDFELILGEQLLRFNHTTGSGKIDLLVFCANIKEQMLRFDVEHFQERLTRHKVT